MTLPNPFKVQNQLEIIVPALQEIWDTVFPYEPQQLTVDCGVKYVVCWPEILIFSLLT